MDGVTRWGQWLRIGGSHDTVSFCFVFFLKTAASGEDRGAKSLDSLDR